MTTHVKKIRMGMLVNPVREEEEVVDDRVEAAAEREVERSVKYRLFYKKMSMCNINEV